MLKKCSLVLLLALASVTVVGPVVLAASNGKTTVSVKEMPVRSDGQETTVEVPETKLGFQRVEKPTVKKAEELAEFAKVGFFASLGIQAILLTVFEVVKIGAVIAVVVLVGKQFVPGLAGLTAMKTVVKTAKGGVRAIGGVGSAVKAYDVAHADLRKKFNQHSTLAKLIDSRLNPAPAPQRASRKKAKVTDGTKAS